jgi:peptidoglycan/LPS O-acetylase OafA/YrhL
LLLVIVFDVIFLACGMPNSIVASLLSVAYVSNYATVANGHYIPSFGHTWSLAVEEHFYFIWPLVLPWLVRRLPPQKVFHATLAFCIAVLVWRIVILQLGAPPRLLYVGSLERSDTLLYGALAAMAVRQGWRPHPALFYFGIALVLGQLILSDFDHVRPIALALGAAFAIVALDHCPLHRVRRLLSAVPMVWLGTVSYGIYLWHGTIFDFFHARGMTSMAYAPLAIGLSIAAAALSHRCLEMPVRQWARARTERVNAPSTGPVSRPLTLEPGSAAAKD